MTEELRILEVAVSDQLVCRPAECRLAYGVTGSEEKRHVLEQRTSLEIWVQAMGLGEHDRTKSTPYASVACQFGGRLPFME